MNLSKNVEVSICLLFSLWEKYWCDTWVFAWVPSRSPCGCQSLLRLVVTYILEKLLVHPPRDGCVRLKVCLHWSQLPLVLAHVSLGFLVGGLFTVSNPYPFPLFHLFFLCSSYFRHWRTLLFYVWIWPWIGSHRSSLCSCCYITSIHRSLLAKVITCRPEEIHPWSH